MGNNTQAALAARKCPVMLRPLGMACRHHMLQATNGVNVHRGRFSLWFSTGAQRLADSRGENRWSKIVSATKVARLSRNIVAQLFSARKSGKSTKSENPFPVLWPVGRVSMESGFRNRQNAGFAGV